MASGSYKQVYVVCPFYKEDDGKRRIVCEGLTDDSIIIQAFKTKEAYERQIDVFCCKECDKCEIYGVLFAKYEE